MSALDKLKLCLPLISGLFFFLFWGCTDEKAKSQSSDASEIQQAETSKVWKQDSLVRENSLSYFLPSNASKSKVCLVFFDPQGEGWEPLDLYKKLASKYGFALVASNLSKNGLDFEEDRRIVNQLIDRINSESGLDSIRFFGVGFSGGARVALQMLSMNPVFEGAIYAGAPGSGNHYDKPIFGFAGNQDMNYADLLAFEQSLSKTDLHFLLEWTGKHEWPPAEMMDNAFTWLKIRQFKNKDFFEKTLLSLERKVKSDKDVLSKSMYFRQMEFLKTSFYGKPTAEPRLVELEKSPAYKQEISSQQSELSKELNLKEMYGKAIFEKDTLWWKAEIASLKAGNRYVEKEMQQRLLGYFSLVSYSLAHRALQENQWEMLDKILFIYRFSDPDNTEAWYLTALLQIKTQKPELALACLQKSKSLGFKDQKRFESEVAFQDLRQKSGFGF